MILKAQIRDEAGQVVFEREDVRSADDMKRSKNGYPLQISLRRFTLGLLTAMAVITALLAAAGIYGVTSYLVAQRTRELGVRMALGATPVRVVTELTRETMLRVAAGCATGTVAAAALSRAMRGFLFGVALYWVAVHRMMGRPPLMSCCRPFR